MWSDRTIRSKKEDLDKCAVEKFQLDIHQKTGSDGSKIYCMDPETVPRITVDACGMTDIAMAKSKCCYQPMVLNVTIDAGPLTQTHQHVTFGLSAFSGVFDPISGLPILGNLQSTNHQWVLGMAHGPESTELHSELIGPCFLDFFCPGHYKKSGNPKPIKWKAVKDENGKDLYPELTNFTVVAPQDMKSHWTTTGCGSASGPLGCLCCMVAKCDRRKCKCKFNPNSGFSDCEWCTTDAAQAAGVIRCHCAKVRDPQCVKEEQSRIEELTSKSTKEVFAWLDKMRKDSQLELDPTIVGKEDRFHHIDYQCPDRGGGRGRTKVDHRRFLKDEIKLRLLEWDPDRCEELLDQDLDEMRDSLKDLCAEERLLVQARDVIQRPGSKHKWFTADQAIPCILHLRMRVMEKALSDLLMFGWSRYGSNETKTRHACIAAVQECMRTEVLGHPESRGQWKYPEIKKSKKVGGGHYCVKKGLTGANARKVLLGLDKLMCCTFSEQFDELPTEPDDNVRVRNALHRQEWLMLWGHAVPVITELDREDDWTDQQIWAYHAHCALFMHRHCDILPDTLITAHIHHIGAGHLTCYLMKHRNLARFQQQGWEAIMKLVHHCCYHNTNHGGSQGNKRGRMEKGEHCMPIVTLHRRRLMWLTGHGDAFFEGQEPDQEDFLDAAHPFIGRSPSQANTTGDIEEGGVAATAAPCDERDLEEGGFIPEHSI